MLCFYGHYIFVMWFLLSIYLLSSFFPRLISAVADGCLPYFYTWCGLSANLECRSEMCCMRLAGHTGRKNDAKNRHLGTIVQLCRAISSQQRQSEKHLLNSNISPRCRYNMENFGQLALKICWRVWGTPANFNGFRVLTALLHGTLEVGVS